MSTQLPPNEPATPSYQKRMEAIERDIRALWRRKEYVGGSAAPVETAPLSAPVYAQRQWWFTYSQLTSSYSSFLSRVQLNLPSFDSAFQIEDQLGPDVDGPLPNPPVDWLTSDAYSGLYSNYAGWYQYHAQVSLTWNSEVKWFHPRYYGGVPDSGYVGHYDNPRVLYPAIAPTQYAARQFALSPPFYCSGDGADYEDSAFIFDMNMQYQTSSGALPNQGSVLVSIYRLTPFAE